MPEKVAMCLCCELERLLGSDGRLIHHGRPGSSGSCPGSNLPPERAALKAEAMGKHVSFRDKFPTLQSICDASRTIAEVYDLKG